VTNAGAGLAGRLAGGCVVLLALRAMAPAARAETFTLGDVQVSFETTLSAGFGIRTSDINPYFLDAAHGGTYPGVMGPSDANWPAGSVFQAPFLGENELQADWRNYTVFVRASYVLDPVLSNPNSASYQPLPHQALITNGHEFQLLDGFVRGKYGVGGQSESVTVGWQTFNWGESLFIRNGLNAVNPIAVAGIHAAGADIRSLYLPTPAIDLKTTLPAGLSLEAFWQFSWDKSLLDPYGTFFSTDVVVTPGDYAIPLPPLLTALGLGTAIPRTDDKTPSDIGNFGVALRGSLFGGAQFGVYFENYGARFPVADFATGAKTPPRGLTYAETTQYYADYPNNVQYVGASLSGDGPFGSALQGEISYSPNTPLQLNPLGLIAASLGPALHARLSAFCNLGIELACQKDAALLGTTIIAEQGLPGYDTTTNGYKRFGMTHLRVSDIASFGGIAGTPIQSWSLAAEYGLDVVNDFPSPSVTPLYRPLSLNALNAGDAAFFSNGVVQSYAQPTQFSEGVVSRAAFNMPGLIAGVIDVNPSLAAEWDFQGTTPAPLITFDEHLLTLTASLGFSYLQRWQATIAYTSHYGLGGSARESVNLDRDYVAASVSYRF